MPVTTFGGKNFEDAVWDHKENDWTGKSFFFVSFTSIFGRPIGLGKKLEQLNRDMRVGGYRPLNNLVWIQYAPFKGRAMVEVTKLDKYDASIVSYEIQTTALSLVYKGDLMGLNGGIKRVKELVFSRKSMEPREVYYLYVPNPDPANFKTVLVALV